MLHQSGSTASLSALNESRDGSRPLGYNHDIFRAIPKTNSMVALNEQGLDASSYNKASALRESQEMLM